MTEAADDRLPLEAADDEAGSADDEAGSGGDADTTLEVSEEVTILLVEDNPGDARLIHEMLDQDEELTQRVTLSGRLGREPSVITEQRLEDGLDVLATESVDIVLLDLNLPDSTGLETLDVLDEATETVPVVVLTGVRDQEVGVRAIKRGAQDFLVKDEVTSPLLVRTIHHAIERSRQRQERRERQTQLKALNNLNRIAHDITHLVITTETRTDLEKQVCERLAEDDAYEFAWVGGTTPGSDRVVARATADAHAAYLEAVEIGTDGGDAAEGPTGRAIRTGRVQITEDLQADPNYEPWREAATAHGFRSSAAIPIVYEGMVYGTLNVYATSTKAFTGPETAVLVRMGDVIGHAIAAIDRREALVSDTVVELEFEVTGLLEPLVALSADESCTIRFERLIREGETLLAYGTADGVSQDQFLETVDETAGIGEMRVLTVGEASFEFELVAPAASSLFETIATHGGRVTSATVDDGEFRFVVELPQGRDTRRVVEHIREQHAGVSYVAQRTTSRDDDRDVSAAASKRSVLEEKLTAKQRTALETAYAAGYFDWPRGSTGEEVAERLDISPATLNQHLRTAERKFFESVFD